MIEKHNSKIATAISANFIACILQWLGDVILKLQGSEIDPATLTFLFTFSAWLVAVFYAVMCGEWKAFATAYPKKQLGRGILVAVSTLLSIYSIIHLPLPEMYTISFLAPIVVTLLGWFLLKEPPAFKSCAAVLIGFVGVLVILRPDGGAFANLVLLAAFLRVIISALCAVLTRSMQHDHLLSFSIYGLGVTWIIALPFAWNHLPAIPLQVVVVFLFLGILGFIANQASLLSMRYAPLGTTSPVQYSKLVLGILSGYIIWNTTPDVYMMAGSVIIILSGLLTAWQPKKLNPLNSQYRIQPAEGERVT